MQNHNVKIKNSAYRPIRPESVESPGAPGEYFLKNKANLQDDQMNVKSIITKDYRRNDAFGVQKTKPINFVLSTA